MVGLFLEVVNMSIAASWLILTVIVIRSFMGKLPKGLRYVLWALVAVRLLCPFSVESALSLIPSVETFSEESMYSQTPEINSGVKALDEVVNPILSGQLSSEEKNFIDENNSTSNTLHETNADFSMQAVIRIIAWIWAAGIVALFLYAMISYIRLKNTVKISVHLRDNLWICDEVQSPFILGLLRPRIYLPSFIEEAQLPYIVAHEKEHLKYHDHWWKPLGFAILTLHWFNPLVLAAYILLCRDIELACDERVIQVMDNEEKKQYSKSLLLCSNPRHTISACPVAFGEIGVKERIKNILNYKKPSVWIIGIGVVVCIVVAVFLGTNPKEYDNIYIEKALEELYSNNFTYIVSVEVYDMKDEFVTYNYIGEYTANPYREQQIYEAGEYYYRENIYNFADLHKDEIVVPYQTLYASVEGYKEDIKVESKKEETIDGKVYIVYNTEYVAEASMLLMRLDKPKAIVPQQYYLDKGSGKIVRIVTDYTDLNRMTYIANVMAYYGMEFETAQKKADEYGRFQKIEDMKIEYQNKNYEIEIPLSSSEIDEIEIFTSHYAFSPPEMLFTITKREEIEELVSFFNEIEYREVTSPDENPTQIDGGGWDFIAFKNDGEIVRTYVIGNPFICCNNQKAEELRILFFEESMTIEHFRDKASDNIWSILSDSDDIEWRNYIENLRNTATDVE